MSEAWLVVLLFGSLCTLLLLRVPLAVGLATATMLTILCTGMPPMLLVERMYAALNYFPLLAIPFFILAGYLMNQGNITDRFIDLAQVLVGHIRGGIAQVNVFCSMMFATVSGTATADTAGMGSMMIPAMVRRGYSPGFSATITAASSTMGAIIPPSVLMIVYGSLTNISMSRLFLAGFIPGALVGISQMAMAWFMAKRMGVESTPRARAPEVIQAFRRCLLPLGVPVIIFGGILSAVFTPTEAGVVAVAYTLVVIVLLRSIRLNQLPQIARDAALMVSLPTFAIAAAVAFGWMVAYLQVPEMVAGLIEGRDICPTTGLLLIVAIFFTVGLFIDGVPAMIIFLPIAQQIAASVGIDPLQMAMVIVMTAALGLITPPFGLCILIAGSIAKVPMPVVIRETMPFVLAMLLLILALILFPQIVLFLPDFIMGAA